MFILAVGTASLVELDGRTFDVAKRAENTAVAGLRFKQRVTTLALVKIDASVGGHFFA